MTPWSAFPTVMFSLVYPFLVIATYAAGDDYRSGRAPMFLVLILILMGLGFCSGTPACASCPTSSH